MATDSTCEIFGETVPMRRLDQMARQIASGIDKSGPVGFAGYVWYRPQAPIQHGLQRSSESGIAERRQVA